VDVRSGVGSPDYGWLVILDDIKAWAYQDGRVDKHSLYIDKEGVIVTESTELSSYRVQDEELST
jgi:hypothetical protein